MISLIVIITSVCLPACVFVHRLRGLNKNYLSIIIIMSVCLSACMFVCLSAGSEQPRQNPEVGHDDRLALSPSLTYYLPQLVCLLVCLTDRVLVCVSD